MVKILISYAGVFFFSIGSIIFYLDPILSSTFYISVIENWHLIRIPSLEQFEIMSENIFERNKFLYEKRQDSEFSAHLDDVKNTYNVLFPKKIVNGKEIFNVHSFDVLRIKNYAIELDKFFAKI